MIEFKGQCGHLIRAREEDAGKVVRCPYCGKEAAVAAPKGDESEAIFDEVERTGHFDAVATRQGHKAAKVRSKQEREGRKGQPSGPLDPFAVTMKMIYVAVIIIIVAVAWKYGSLAIQKLRENGPTIIAGGSTKPTPAPTAHATATSAAPENRLGLLIERLNPDQEGAYVSSVPAGAIVFSLAQAGGDISLVDDPTADRNMETNGPLRLTHGKHTVALAIRVNHPALMELPGYAEARRKIESDQFDNSLLVRSYFAPDGSTHGEVRRMRGLLHIVRTYEVEIPARTWAPVTGLFLPRGKLADVLPHLPNKIAYGFDEQQVKSELGFYNVPPGDQGSVLEGLRRLGKVSYEMGAGGSYRLFQIHLRDGVLTSEELTR